MSDIENPIVIDAEEVDAEDVELEGLDALASGHETERRPYSFTGARGAPHPAAVPAGSRAARRAAAVAGDEHAGARHNWLPAGPRNLGGRTRALAVHPTDPRIMYAGTASGGVFKSEDGGESWRPLWHDQICLTVGALSLCRDQPDVVWAATGEVGAAPKPIDAGGVFRSTDGGLTWDPHDPTVAARPDTFDVDAIAAHPFDPLHAWVVTGAGVYRTLDGGANWLQFTVPGTFWSDVQFRPLTGAELAARDVNAVRVFLVGGDPSNGLAFVIRIDKPHLAAKADIDAQMAPGRRDVIPAPVAPATLQSSDPRPTRGKLAIAPSARNVAYVRFVGHRNDKDSSNHHLGIWRTTTLDAATGAGVVWQKMADSPAFGEDEQGEYTLALAVSPANENHLATGVLEVNVHTSAASAAALANGGLWKRAVVWELLMLDEAHHADTHALVFAPVPGGGGGDPQLWVANDGGISVSRDWRTGDGYPKSTTLPLPENAITWRKRSHGLVAAQMYDLTQHPAVPTLMGCGFQDNGVWISNGSGTWRMVMAADGGFVAWDPDDPYRFLVTDQNDLAEAVFVGRLAGVVPGRKQGIQSELWPRELRQGVLAFDPANFVFLTVAHPQRPGRVLHGRRNRLYGLRPGRGDHLDVEGVGHGFELAYTPPPLRPLGPQDLKFAEVEVVASEGAAALGLLPGKRRVERQKNPDATEQSSLDEVPNPTARVRSIYGGPYTLARDATVELKLRPGRTLNPPKTARLVEETVRFTVPAGTYQVGDLVAAVRGQIPAVDALPQFWHAPTVVQIATSDVGAAAKITAGGADVGLFTLQAGAYTGGPGRPAVVLVPVDAAGTFGTPGATLTLAVGNRPARTIHLPNVDVPDTNLLRPAEYLAAFRRALAGEPVRIEATNAAWSLVLTGTKALKVTGSANSQLNFSVPKGAATSTMVAVRPDAGWDLSTVTAPVRLVIEHDGKQATATFAPPPPRQVAIDRLQATIQSAIDAGPLNGAVTCRVDVIHVGAGVPSSVAFSPSQPDTIWLGSVGGTIFCTDDDGAHWRAVDGGPVSLRNAPVAALAVHPTDPRVVYAGLLGHDIDSSPTGFLYRSRDGGVTWTDIGATITASNTGTPFTTGVHAIEIDPGTPARVFVGTSMGVFRSVDGGDHWAPFNEGLPNAAVSDLGFAAATRTLRAGVWGRGTYARHVGDSPPRDVRLHLRVHDADEGTDRPAAAVPDAFALSPANLPYDQSPDVKVVRHPPDLGDVVDGAEMDLRVAHDPLVSGEAATVFVQVHNRGSFPATDVRAVVLWAPVDDGPPPLGDDFWARLRAGTLAAGDATGAWKVLTVGPVPPLAGRSGLEAGHPQVLRSAVTTPDVGTARRVGLLGVVTCREDTPTTTERDVERLVDREARVAYRVSSVDRLADDQTMFLRSVDGRPFRVAVPPGSTTFDAAGAALTSLVGRRAATFNVSAGTSGLTVTRDDSVTVRILAADVADVNRVSSAELARAVNRDLRAAGAAARMFELVDATTRLEGFGAARLQVTGGSMAGTLGYAIGAALATSRDGSKKGPFRITLPADLTVRVVNSAKVTLDKHSREIPDRTKATAGQIRAAMNRQLLAAALPVRADVPRVDLWVRRSVSDVDRVPVRLGGHHLADLVAAPAAVAVAARPALFDLVTVLGADTLRVGENRLYLRSSNLGAANRDKARHRLFVLDLATSPLGTTSIEAAKEVDLAAGASAIVEFTHTVAAGTSGAVHILAVVDHATDGTLDVSAIASVDALESFCRVHPNAALRTFTVGP